MRTRFRSRSVFGIALLFGLSGCIAGGSSTAPSGLSQMPSGLNGSQAHPRAKASPKAQHRKLGHGWLSPAGKARNGLIYVAAPNGIVIFPTHPNNPNAVGTITDGVSDPYGLFIDLALNLYVVNQSNSVEVYPPGSTTPSMSYSQGLSRPLYAVADSQRLFVGNANSGQIVEYTLGNAQPQYTLQSLGSEVDGIALDAAGDLYASYRGGGHGGGIQFFALGIGTGQDLGITLSSPQGMQIDEQGDIIVVETDGPDRVDAFHPGQTTPFATTPGLNGVPTGIALNQREHQLYISELSAVVQKTKFPKMSEIRTFSQGKLEGAQDMAISPPAAPTPIPSPTIGPSPNPSGSPAV
jgi:hypothetical protein